MRIGRPRLGVVPVLVAVLTLCGCTSMDPRGQLVAGSHQLTVVPVPAPAPAAPDPAAPDPAAPDPAAPDPAAPDPAAPDPITAPDAGEGAGLQEAAEAAAVTESPMAVACADVIEALTDAVVSYEAVALAEGGVGGDRADAAEEMRAAWHRARAAADRVGGGLPAAAAPAMAAVTALHDGLATRATLDESDADPWREAREALQNWCRARG